MVGRELAQATLGMIGGQYRDITGETADLAALHRLKTGALFAAAVGSRLWVAEVPEPEQPAWRAFGEELGLLFQAIDDLLDGDGYAAVTGSTRLGGSRTRRPGARTSGSGSIPADTSVLAEIVAASPRARPRCARRHTCWLHSERWPSRSRSAAARALRGASGDLVLKPLDSAMSPDELEWQGVVLHDRPWIGVSVLRSCDAPPTARRSSTAGAHGSTSRAGTRSGGGPTWSQSANGSTPRSTACLGRR